MIHVENIPEELKYLAQWVVWRSETRNDKATKIPYQLDGKPASVTDPEHWATFAEIYWAEPVGFSGVGFVFTKDDPYVGIDLDNCRDPGTGEITDWGLDIIGSFQSYTEVSPSMCGVKIWAKGELPINESGKRKKWKSGAVEMYQHSRFFTVTGMVV